MEWSLVERVPVGKEVQDDCVFFFGGHGKCRAWLFFEGVEQFSEVLLFEGDVFSAEEGLDFFDIGWHDVEDFVRVFVFQSWNVEVEDFLFECCRLFLVEACKLVEVF